MVITNRPDTNDNATNHILRKGVQANNTEISSKETVKGSVGGMDASVAVVLNLSQSPISKTAKTVAATYSGGTATLKMGSRGNAVTLLQKNLTELGYDTKGADGIFGNNTRAAVIEFQKAYGLTADGIVGKNTQNQINKSLANHRNNLLLVGSRGESVKKLQQNLTALGYDTKGCDGIFGKNTENAVKAFQRAYNLAVDGMAGTNTHKAINNALNTLVNIVDGNVNISTNHMQMINNIKNDTSLGLSTSKKTAMITAAERMFSEGYEVEFIAGVLANIQSEGTPGRFESSNYTSNPNAKPGYLKYMDANFNYRNEFSGKTISQVGIDKAIALQKKVVNCGYQGKFGFGMVQWTGSRTSGVLAAYEKYCTSNYPTEDECAKAEANYLVDELQGSYKYVYNNWKNGARTAQSAGEIVCKQYEVPANATQQAITRGQNANKIYNIMMKK